jgi:DNA-binding GntR family transcriptional regulator
MSALRRTTLVDEVYESIKTMIMDHVLAPGARASIDSLARELDVSQTPVRESLARLVSDGLVAKRPMVGYTVTPLLTRDEFEHLFQVRLILEPEAAAMAAQRQSIVDGSLPRTSAGGYQGHAAFTAADAAFHHVVAAASGNPLLLESIDRLHAHLHLHRLHVPSNAVRTTRAEHRLIAAGLAAGQPDQAHEAMRQHLLAARSRHLAFWD